MGSDLVGHRAKVWLGADQLRVDYELELPTSLVLRELRVEAARGGPLDAAAQQAWMAQRHDDIEDSLLLRFDGQPAAWTRAEPVAASGVGDERFVSFRIALVAAVPPGARTCNLVDLNEPETPGLVSMDLWVADDLRLEATSLVELVPGRRARDHSGQWRADEQSRELRLAFARRPAVLATLHGLLRRLSQPALVDGTPAGIAVGAVRLSDVVREHVLPPRGVAVGLGLAAAFAAVSAVARGPVRRSGPALTAVVVVLSLVVGLQTLAPPVLPPVVCVGITAALAGHESWRALRRRRAGTRPVGTGGALSTDGVAWWDAPGLALLAVAWLVGGPAFAGAAGLVYFLVFILMKSVIGRGTRSSVSSRADHAPALVALWLLVALGLALAG